jgi:hypothetical protein
MIESKIPIFEGVPNSELSKLTEDENGDGVMNNLRNIEKEFAETNQHTKQTHIKDDNTNNTDNTVNSGADTFTNDDKPKRKTRLSNLMGEKGGSFAVELIDMLIPSIVVLIISYFGYVLEKKDLK